MDEFFAAKRQFSRLLRCLGLDLLDEDFRPSFKTLAVGIVVAATHLGTFTALFRFWPEVGLVIRTLSLYGFCVQVGES